MIGIRYQLLGEVALLVQIDAPTPEARNAGAIALADAIDQAPLTGILDRVPAIESLLIFFDPLVPQFDLQILLDYVNRIDKQIIGDQSATRLPFTIDVCYGGEAGPDLEMVAASLGLSPAEVIKLHTDAIQRVQMIGFAPGYPYLSGLPAALHLPRRANPRSAVPAGSVAIAAGMTGIYPSRLPGGWHLIGQTATRLFDPYADPPTLLQAGDRVQFVAVETLPEPKPLKAELFSAPTNTTFEIEILQPGPLSSVQDGGRLASRRYGVPVGGALDRFALAAANQIVGNQAGAAAIEITASGFQGRFHGYGWFAICGAANEIHLDGRPLAPWSLAEAYPGAQLTIGARREDWRARSYLALAGVLAVPTVLGGAGWCPAGGFGGGFGRALRARDRLLVQAPRRAPVAGATWPFERRPAYQARPSLGLLAGPHLSDLENEALQKITAQPYTIGAQANRMGYRLDGPPIAHRQEVSLASLGVFPGVIQVPPDGQPILLMADAQTTGGYPIIGVVCAVDLPLAAQMFPGDQLQFHLIDRETAIAALQRQQAWLAQGPDPDPIAIALGLTGS